MAQVCFVANTFGFEGQTNKKCPFSTKYWKCWILASDAASCHDNSIGYLVKVSSFVTAAGILVFFLVFGSLSRAGLWQTMVIVVKCGIYMTLKKIKIRRQKIQKNHSTNYNSSDNKRNKTSIVIGKMSCRDFFWGQQHFWVCFRCSCHFFFVLRYMEHKSQAEGVGNWGAKMQHHSP